MLGLVLWQWRFGATAILEGPERQGGMLGLGHLLHPVACLKWRVHAMLIK